MKKYQLISSLVLLIFILTSGMMPDGSKETRKVAPFDELKVYGRFDVVLIRGSEESVTLER